MTSTQYTYTQTSQVTVTTTNDDGIVRVFHSGTFCSLHIASLFNWMANSGRVTVVRRPRQTTPDSHRDAARHGFAGPRRRVSDGHGCVV
jgi:hypothetical protein